MHIEFEKNIWNYTEGGEVAQPTDDVQKEGNH